jgi:multiple sugar transport system ATP-binding protein
MGADAYVYATPQDTTIQLEGAEDEETVKPFIARVDGRRPPDRGQTVYVYPHADHLHVFNRENGTRINN